ncbi:uncharacterized protein AB675_7259 [Cyphellophora attinorum]|uniref:C2H2-type domain-containing protein n=1 Tax=Cyphellophora attinorum TaxID=1664694 RepID=A0A0N0NJ86_9EURO|nr:uncharacterized protein AB675_7259 [Phialophora attinorum]KPI36329.1 hypothetical protein AB675_7259 [Phialophora attinorum]
MATAAHPTSTPSNEITSDLETIGQKQLMHNMRGDNSTSGPVNNQSGGVLPFEPRYDDIPEVRPAMEQRLSGLNLIDARRRSGSSRPSVGVKDQYVYWRLEKVEDDWGTAYRRKIPAPQKEIERMARKGPATILGETKRMGSLRASQLEKLIEDANTDEKGDYRWEPVYINSLKISRKTGKVECKSMDVILARVLPAPKQSSKLRDSSGDLFDVAIDGKYTAAKKAKPTAQSKKEKGSRSNDNLDLRDPFDDAPLFHKTGRPLSDHGQHQPDPGLYVPGSREPPFDPDHPQQAYFESMATSYDEMDDSNTSPLTPSGFALPHRPPVSDPEYPRWPSPQPSGYTPSLTDGTSSISDVASSYSRTRESFARFDRSDQELSRVTVAMWAEQVRRRQLAADEEDQLREYGGRRTRHDGGRRTYYYDDGDRRTYRDDGRRTYYDDDDLHNTIAAFPRQQLRQTRSPSFSSHTNADPLSPSDLPKSHAIFNSSKPYQGYEAERLLATSESLFHDHPEPTDGPAPLELTNAGLAGYTPLDRPVRAITRDEGERKSKNKKRRRKSRDRMSSPTDSTDVTQHKLNDEMTADSPTRSISRQSARTDTQASTKIRAKREDNSDRGSLVEESTHPHMATPAVFEVSDLSSYDVVVGPERTVTTDWRDIRENMPDFPVLGQDLRNIRAEAKFKKAIVPMDEVDSGPAPSGSTISADSEDQHDVVHIRFVHACSTVLVSAYVKCAASNNKGKGSGHSAKQVAETSSAANLNHKRNTRSDEDGDDTVDPGGNGGKKRPKQGSDEPPARLAAYRNLACPFNKFNTLLFGPDSPDPSYHGCATCNFVNIAYLKQHLKRNHYTPQHYCFRCCESFESQLEAIEHSRRQPVCETLEPRLFRERIGPDLVEELGLRGKNSPGTDPVQYWYRIYHALFPGAAEQRPVSPYYEGPTAEYINRFVHDVQPVLPDLVSAAQRALGLNFELPLADMVRLVEEIQQNAIPLFLQQLARNNLSRGALASGVGDATGTSSTSANPPKPHPSVVTDDSAIGDVSDRAMTLQNPSCPLLEANAATSQGSSDLARTMPGLTHSEGSRSSLADARSPSTTNEPAPPQLPIPDMVDKDPFSELPDHANLESANRSGLELADFDLRELTDVTLPPNWDWDAEFAQLTQAETSSVPVQFPSGSNNEFIAPDVEAWNDGTS